MKRHFDKRFQRMAICVEGYLLYRDCWTLACDANEHIVMMTCTRKSIQRWKGMHLLSNAWFRMFRPKWFRELHRVHEARYRSKMFLDDFPLQQYTLSQLDEGDGKKDRCNAHWTDDEFWQFEKEESSEAACNGRRLWNVEDSCQKYLASRFPKEGFPTILSRREDMIHPCLSSLAPSSHIGRPGWTSYETNRKNWQRLFLFFLFIWRWVMLSKFIHSTSVYVEHENPCLWF